MKAHDLGREGERFALQYLAGRGYLIRDANYRIKLGEIDIIADDKGTICFIEVKTRLDDGSDPFEAVDWRKQRRMSRVAQAYLIENFGTVDVSARFDVLAVHRNANGEFQGELLKNAFEC